MRGSIFDGKQERFLEGAVLIVRVVLVADVWVWLLTSVMLVPVARCVPEPVTAVVFIAIMLSGASGIFMTLKAADAGRS